MDKLHPVNVVGESGPELGRKIVAMRYDKVLEVVTGMKDEALRQAEGDAKRGYKKLSQQLDDLYWALRLAEVHLEEICQICRPHIQEEIDFRNKPFDPEDF